MFEIGWSELLVIGIVLIVVVGPKDLPRMLRTFGKVSGQMRRMAGDFRRQFDEALREAELDDVRDTVNEMRSLDPTKDIRSALNPIRAVGDEIRSSLAAATKAPEPKIASASAPATPIRPADMEPAAGAVHDVSAETHLPTSHTDGLPDGHHRDGLPEELNASGLPPRAAALNGAHGKSDEAAASGDIL